MAAITEQNIIAAYQIARQVADKNLKESDGVRHLVESTGMNKSSASAYIRALTHMLEGAAYTRTLSQTATRYYITGIFDDYGHQKGMLAISALQKHIDYYENHTKTRMQALRGLVKEFTVNSHKYQSIDIIKNFEVKVMDSLNLESHVRKSLLPPKGSKPNQISQIVQTFVRNQHVVAEILNRANGLCENCKLPAPFKRRSNNMPYLEVHHHVRLADGGGDTVENAIAVCPNCHRKAHYG